MKIILECPNCGDQSDYQIKLSPENLKKFIEKKSLCEKCLKNKIKIELKVKHFSKESTATTIYDKNMSHVPIRTSMPTTKSTTR